MAPKSLVLSASAQAKSRSFNLSGIALANLNRVAEQGQLTPEKALHSVIHNAARELRQQEMLQAKIRASIAMYKNSVPPWIAAMALRAMRRAQKAGINNPVVVVCEDIKWMGDPEYKACDRSSVSMRKHGMVVAALRESDVTTPVIDSLNKCHPKSRWYQAEQAKLLEVEQAFSRSSQDVVFVYVRDTGNGSKQCGETSEYHVFALPHQTVQDIAATVRGQ